MAVKVCTFTSQQEFSARMQQADLKDKLVVIDFTATWCGPCKAIKPKFAALAEKYTSIECWSIDVDDNDTLTEDLGVNAMPTFQFWKNNQKVDEFTGADANKLEEIISEHLQ